MARKRGNHYADDLESVDPDKVQALVGSILELNRMGKCKTNDELRDRIDQYFAFCLNHKLRPGIESLCTSLSITRTTLYQWKNGRDCDPERTDIIQQAISVIHTFIEQAGLQGLVNPATFIFIAKNWLGYKDTVSIEESTPISGKSNRIDRLQIAKQLGIPMNDIPEKTENQKNEEL